MKTLWHNVAWFLAAAIAVGWGFPAHRWINGIAIHGLPPELHGWFKSHADWLAEHAVDADRRKHTMEGESERHYIDLDRYHGELDTLRAWFPCAWTDACSRWGEDIVRDNGIAPWNAVWAYRRLEDAFAERNAERILRAAADLGHYIGDLHVPLHATANYDGQLTDQQGIHGLWEGQIPEQFRTSYRLTPQTARYCKDPERSVWAVAFESFAAVDSVLQLERSVSQSFDEGTKYGYLERGRVLDKRYALSFCDAYHQALDGMVERRLQQSIQLTADLWYSAWLEAGAPALPEPPEHPSFWTRFLSWLTG